jgi:hypothetical protein
MSLWQKIKLPPWRTIVPGCGLLLILACGFWLWSLGLDVRDGRHDRGQNAIWISHGWLGDDGWFTRNGKTNEFERYRDQQAIRALAAKLRQHHIADIYPHLCPADIEGPIPAVDVTQTEKFLDEFAGFRVMPWIGGPNGGSVRYRNEKWRQAFLGSVKQLLEAHPRFAGVHLNVEPLTSGDADFLIFLDDLKAVVSPEKLLSIAAYPPPTRWQPSEEVHWSEDYFRQIAKRCDQVAVMMYDTSLRVPKLYQRLMADWTTEVLAWSEGKPILLGVPTYSDTGVEYHHPRVESLRNALLGIHRGLSRQSLPTNYQGVAIYCDWETDDSEWKHFQEHFVKQ